MIKPTNWTAEDDMHCEDLANSPFLDLLGKIENRLRNEKLEDILAITPDENAYLQLAKHLSTIEGYETFFVFIKNAAARARDERKGKDT